MVLRHQINGVASHQIQPTVAHVGTVCSLTSEDNTGTGGAHALITRIAPCGAIDLPVGFAEGVLESLVRLGHAPVIHASDDLDRHVAGHFASGVPSHTIGNQGQQAPSCLGTGWLWIGITGAVFITEPKTTLVTEH